MELQKATCVALGCDQKSEITLKIRLSDGTSINIEVCRKCREKFDPI
jgi:hypothetical protein